MGKALSKILFTNWLFIHKWHICNQFPNEQDVRGLIPRRAFFLFRVAFLSFFRFFFFFWGGGGLLGLALYKFCIFSFPYWPLFYFLPLTQRLHKAL